MGEAEAVLRADATGVGRDHWPTVFGSRPGPAAAPFGRFHIQAAIARRDGTRRQAVVHLIWAAADLGGSYAAGRVTDVYFTRALAKGRPAWTPHPLA